MDNEKSTYFIIITYLIKISNQNIFVQALQAGAELCLIKPINQSNLIEYVEGMLKSRANKAAGNQATERSSQSDLTPDLEAHSHSSAPLAFTVCPWAWVNGPQCLCISHYCVLIPYVRSSDRRWAVPLSHVLFSRRVKHVVCTLRF